MDETMNPTKPRSSYEILAEMEDLAAKADDLIFSCKCLPRQDAFAALKADAVASHAQYPQYNGHWDNNWRLCRITRKISTKMGVAFHRGDLAIMKVEPNGDIFAYSNRNGIDTQLGPRDVQEVQ